MPASSELRNAARFHADSATPTRCSAGKRHAEPVRKFREVPYDVIWRGSVVRPRARRAVQPDGRQTGVLCATDVGIGIVADVDDARTLDTARVQQMPECTRIGLEGARGARRDVPLKIFREPDALQVGVA